MSYQSFPWQKGDSQSMQKLMRLHLPALEGKEVLDAGCNTGFFCGFAAYAGASRVVGIDINESFINAARDLFPACEFRCQNWSDLGDEKFDIILCISAIHYAEDQKAAIDWFMRHLKPNGMLILEMGIAPGDEDKFVEVSRSVDKRFFPTFTKLKNMLGDYAIKYGESSVPQIGDPVPRRIFHIRWRRPVAVLLMDDPYAGKTTIAREIFNDSLQYISGDRLFAAIAEKTIKVPPAIETIIAGCMDGDEVNSAAAVYAIGKHNLLRELCDIIARVADGKGLALDMYVSRPFRLPMCDCMTDAGYFVADLILHGSRRHSRARDIIAKEVYHDYWRHLEEMAQSG